MTTTAIDLGTWFVLHDGLADDGTVTDTNPLAGSGGFEAEMRSEFNETINKGYANKDLGLFLVKLTDVSAEQAEELEDNLEAVVASGFKGYNVEVLEEYRSKLSDWAPEALADLDDLDAGVEADADGWVRN